MSSFPPLHKVLALVSVLMFLLSFVALGFRVRVRGSGSGSGYGLGLSGVAVSGFCFFGVLEREV